MQKTKKKTNTVTEILQHDVSWFVESNSVTELDECSIEHIEESIKDGYSSGSLHVTYGKSNNKETSGYWRIINWKNIALQCYNGIKNPHTAKEAIEAFDNEWGI